MFIAAYRNTERGARAILQERTKDERRRQFEERLARAKAAQMAAEEKQRKLNEEAMLRARYAAMTERSIVDLIEAFEAEHSFEGRPASKVIADAVAATTGMPAAEILSPSRRKAVVKARDLLIWEINRLWKDASLPMIGRAVFRDHTSVLASLRRTRRTIGGNG